MVVARARSQCARVVSGSRLGPSKRIAPVRTGGIELSCAMVKTFVHMNDFELGQARRWRKEGKGISEIAKLLARDERTVSRRLKRPARQRPPKQGRPLQLTPAVCKTLEQSLNVLLKQANAEKEVTVAMVKEHAQSNLSERSIRDAFHKRGIRFHKLREKPILTLDDVKARRDFASQYLGKTKAQWLANPHAIVDNKHFLMCLEKKGRSHAARRSVRGAYRRGKEQSVAPHLVKPKDTIKFPAKSVAVTAAVVKGRVRVWHYVEGRWNAQKAVRVYEGRLVKVLRKSYPNVEQSARGRYVALEDNDPAGCKASAAVRAKAALRISTMNLPRRSPDLNVLDYSLWREINVRMREQEKGFAENKKESVEEFKKRLRRTALSLPQSVVSKAAPA